MDLELLKQIADQFIESYCWQTNHKYCNQSTDFLIFVNPKNHDLKKKNIKKQILNRPKLTIQRQSNDLQTIVNLLYPKYQNIPPFRINIIDTIFYFNESPSVYVFFNQQKNILQRIYNKSNKNITGILEKFLSRKNQLQKQQKGTLNFITSQTITQRHGKKVSTLKSTQRSKNRKKQCYPALLKYKQKYEQIEITQNDIVTIFQNPLYINPKLKQLNNTLYIQRLVAIQSLTNNNSLRIDFDYEIFNKSRLFNSASDYICRYSYKKEIDQIQKEIEKYFLDLNVQLYLNYLVFKLVVYIYIHHNKKIKKGIFNFIKDQKQKYLLCSIQSLEIQNMLPENSQYQKIKIISEFQIPDSITNQQTSLKPNIFYQTALSIFDQYNQKLQSKVDNFVASTFDFIQNPVDTKQSNVCFNKLIKPYTMNFKQVLNNSQLCFQLLKKNQKRNSSMMKGRKLLLC